MSSNVEDQIVSMQFDNKQFESGVATSLGTIDKLNSSLKFSSGVQGINDINRAASGMNLNPIASGIQGINKAWLGMTTIAVTALSNITNKAVDAGLRMAKSLTLDPIAEGFQNYETKINAVQTILANTADAGTTLKDVTKNLDELNTYANKTVYNFSEMAKNIGTFTAAGVDLKTSTESIKGIANLAALSGSSSAQASQAMYQLSQAIAAGQVHLQDWNSVVNAGIGGAAFQKNLIQSALATGTLDASQVHLGKTMADTTVNGVAFRQSLTPPPGGTSWLTSGVLTKSLGTFTGDMSKAQLAAQGFQKDQIKAILAQGKTAVNAATQIKTFTQLFQALKEEVGTAYASVFEALFGNINQAKAFLSPLHTFIENGLTQPIYAVADALKSWRQAGGFDDLVTIFTNLGAIVGNLLAPFKQIFGVLLPSTGDAGKGLEGITKTIAVFTGFIVKLTDPIGNVNLKLSFMGKIFKIVGGTISAFVSALKPLLPILSDLASYVGDLFNQGMDIAGNLIAGWTAGLDPKALQAAAVQLANSWITWIKDALGIHSPASTMVPIGLNIMQGIVEGLQHGSTFVIGALQKIFTGLGKAIKWMVENISWGDVLDTINTGLFLGVVLLFKHFVTAFSGTLDQFKALMGKAGGVLDQMTSNLKTMQQKVKSEIIRNIAISVGILAASAFVLSKVDGKKLAVSLGAIAGMMTALLGVMFALGSGGGKGKHIDNKAVARQTAQMVAMSGALIAFATAVLILSSAVALMGQLDPKTIERGLGAVAGVITLIVAATAILGKTGGGATILATATALIVLSVGLTAFVGVMKLYEKLDWKTLVRGGGSAAAVILAIGLAMRGFNKVGLSGSVGLIAASIALRIMASALTELAKIGLGDMIKTVVALDLVIGSLVFAAESMSAAEGGAASMLVMSAALIVLAKALQIISKIPFWDLVKAIGAIVVAILLIAGTSAALSELSPFILALGIALLTVGAALFLAGAGMFLFASALGILAIVGPAAFQALHDGIDQLLDLLPKIGEAIGGFVVSILTGIVKAAGPLAKALGKLLEILLDAGIKLIPKVQRLIQKVINAIIEVLIHSQGHIYKVMLNFVLNMLDALNDGVPKMIKKGTDLIVGVITGLSKANVKIANATGKAILDFLRGLDKAINKYEPKIIAEGLQIGKDLIQGLLNGIKDGIPGINDAISGLAHSALDNLKKPWKMWSPSRATRQLGQFFSQGAALGIDDHSGKVEDSARKTAKKALDAMKLSFKNSRSGASGLEDLRPKITPILDLTQLEKDASQIGSHMGHPKISADVSRRTARDIAADAASRHRGDEHTAGDTYEFVQNNYSPEPINHVRAYRGTKSQIALLKEVTGK